MVIYKINYTKLLDPETETSLFKAKILPKT